MKCAIYARFSTDNQNDESIDSQVAFCTDYIKSQGWELLPDYIYTDYAISGGTDRRRAFQACIEAAKKKQFDALVVFATSRFAREQYDELHYTRVLETAGVRLISASERLHDLEGVARIASESSIRMANEIIRYQIKDHAARGVKHVTDKGFIATKPCYGYRKKYIPDPDGAIEKKTNKVRQRLTFDIVEEEANVVRRIFNLYLDGKGAKKIAQTLNQEGIQGPAGDTWTFTTIRDMLRRQTYLGWIVRNKRSKIKGPDGKRKYTRNRREQWHIKKDAFPAIIDEETFAEVRKRIEAQADKWDASALRARENHSRYLLTGIMKCAECGKNFICRKTRNKKGDKVYHHYVCSGRNSRGPAGCPNATAIVRDEIESYLLKFCGARMYDPAAVKHFSELADRIRETALKEHEANCEQLEKDLSKLTKKRTALLEDYERFDHASRNVVRDKIQELSGQIDKLSEKLAMPKRLDEVFQVSTGGIEILIPAKDLNPKERIELLKQKADEFERDSREGDVFSARERIKKIVKIVRISADGMVLIFGSDKQLLEEKNLIDLRHFTSEIEKKLLLESSPISCAEPTWRISRKLFEELCKDPESKKWVDEMMNLVNLELVEDEKEAQTGRGLGLFILYDKPPENFFTEDMLEYGVPKGIKQKGKKSYLIEIPFELKAAA